MLRLPPTRKMYFAEKPSVVYRNLLSVQEVGLLARERWLVPRAATRPEYKEWRREQLQELLSVTRCTKRRTRRVIRFPHDQGRATHEGLDALRQRTPRQ